MGKVELIGLLFNLIVFCIFSIPIAIAFFKKDIFSSRSNLITAISIVTILEIFLYMILYLFPEKVFSIFPGAQGYKNYAYYASRIVFICAPFYSLMFLISKYLFINWNKKNTTIFVISKIVVLVLLMFLGNLLFSSKGILFAIPLSDILYIIPIFIIFLR